MTRLLETHLLFYTPQTPLHCAKNKQKFHRVVNYQYCRNVSVHKQRAEICTVLQMTSDSTHSTPIPAQLFVH